MIFQKEELSGEINNIKLSIDFGRIIVLYYISTFLGAFILVRNFMYLKMCKNYRQSNG